MDDAQSKDLITSKEILSVTGISRATLNNYIKMGIIPKPVVRKPIAGMEGVKKIGYFPRIVLDRIKTVKELKGKGHSMEERA
jgi:predicted site-specific integrase-resolvase